MPPTDNRYTPTRRSVDIIKSEYHTHAYDAEADTSLQDRPALETQNPGSSSSSKPHSNYVSFLDKLKLLPEVRISIPWRPGQELPPEKAGDSTRVQQRGAILLSTRGTAMADPCALCAGGYGRFAVCVTLENWFQGACSSCIFTSKGNKCSLRTQTSGTEDGRALRYHADGSVSRSQNLEESSKKRKRTALPPKQTLPITQSTKYTSIYPQIQPPHPAPLDLDMLLQASIASDQIDEPDSPDRIEVRPAPRLSHPEVARPSAGAFVPSPYQDHAKNRRSKAATLFPRDPGPVSQIGNGTLQPVAATWEHQMIKSKGPPVPASNFFTKAKQREVYDIVSQCQGGIDELQRQLDTLKSVFGINDQALRD
ncbi:uncharacterized protein RSE6_03712 [Rhynchosporium secalis]|uniref:Uncharacterized protein n=1 Tax=Rhynchosporium secalis TaxID=38038 RepID=A0A1E1M3H6_RHYSE|nr:uncharacterized protein RSE6_03712 [Rhynchosporium secalis]